MTIELNKIIICDNFKKYLPNENKFIKKYKYYKDNNRFQENIFINHKNELTDGYTSYLLAKMLGFESVDVQYNYMISYKKAEEATEKIIKYINETPVDILIKELQFEVDINQ